MGTSPELLAQYGKDAFCPVPALNGQFHTGDMVEFEVGVKNGQPQAMAVRAPGSYAPTPQAFDATETTSGTSDDVGKEFFGQIMPFRKGNKFCFIDCPEVKAKYGNDTWCPLDILTG